MTELMNLGNEKTITSLEFLEVINVLRINDGQNKLRNNDFTDRIEDEVEDLGAYKSFVNPQNRKPQKYYLLNEDQMMLVGMRESKVVRRGVLDYVKKLKQPKTRLELAKETVSLIEALENQEEQLKLQEPKVNAFDTISNSSRLSTVSEVSALFGMGRNSLYKWLKANKYVMKNHKPFQKWINQDLFDYKIDEHNSKMYYVTLISGKGILYLQGEFEENNKF